MPVIPYFFVNVTQYVYQIVRRPVFEDKAKIEIEHLKIFILNIYSWYFL